ncbi:unnamed protein product [Heligmosomoides polygyrus]|uniref:Secreted protein n=1 Tax=Heligmosomoides polygyrus TaxID=6339 RepID=A0A183GRI2_HELPZ|nr:unnamed protein product [Heligmosomoides polygyrus]
MRSGLAVRLVTMMDCFVFFVLELSALSSRAVRTNLDNFVAGLFMGVRKLAPILVASSYEAKKENGAYLNEKLLFTSDSRREDVRTQNDETH